MDGIVERCKDIDFSWLPEKIGDFVLHLEQQVDGKNIYRFFHYENPKGWKWEALYDKEVGDYMGRVVLPLVDFVDIAFAREKLEPFLEVLQSSMVTSLEERFMYPEKRFTYEYKKKGIHTWDYKEALPERIGDYVRDLTPDKGMFMINGSFLIGEYVKADKKTGVILFYNVFRDEFFAEIREDGYPGITHDLDAVELEEFNKVLIEFLPKVLRELA